MPELQEEHKRPDIYQVLQALRKGGEVGMTPDKNDVIKALEFCLMPTTNEELMSDVCSHDDCPYYRAYSGGKCVNAVVGDALALLKAQEPHVLTLEEVKMLDRDYYYLESMRGPYKELKDICGAYGLTCVTWPSITWARQTMGDNGYFKTWRCWTSRPTEAERKMTPWNSTSGNSAEPEGDITSPTR